MTDAGLLAFGCGVTFIALAGAYSYLRGSFEARTRRPIASVRSREAA